MRKIADNHSLPLIYDSAQAFGASYKGTKVGSLADAEILSFHATKLIHTGEGGAIVTNNTDLYEKLCRSRNFGFSGNLNCVQLGINGKMSEFAAMIGTKLLDLYPTHLARRQQVFQQYDSSLNLINGIEPLYLSTHSDHSYSYYPIIVDEKEFGLNNIELCLALEAENIISRCYFYPPVHRTPYYQKILGPNQVDLPVTDWAALHLISLPVYSDMLDTEIAKIIKAIQRCHEHAKTISKALEDHIPPMWEPL